MVVLELLPHDEEWVLARLGHQHLGFDPQSVREAMIAVGIDAEQVLPAPRDAASPFKAFLLTGTRTRKTAAHRHARRPKSPEERARP